MRAASRGGPLGRNRCRRETTTPGGVVGPWSVPGPSPPRWRARAARLERPGHRCWPTRAAVARPSRARPRRPPAASRSRERHGGGRWSRTGLPEPDPSRTFRAEAETTLRHTRLPTQTEVATSCNATSGESVSVTSIAACARPAVPEQLRSGWDRGSAVAPLLGVAPPSDHRGRSAGPGTGVGARSCVTTTRRGRRGGRCAHDVDPYAMTSTVRLGSAPGEPPPQIGDLVG